MYFCSNFALPVGAIQNDFFDSTRDVQSTSCSPECNGISLKTADKKGAVTWKRVSGIFIFICLLFLGKGQSKRSNILYADKLFHSFIDILQIAQRK